MEYLKYKGYTGSVEYSEEDHCLYGKVLGMSTHAITYEGQNVDELKKDFVYMLINKLFLVTCL